MEVICPRNRIFAFWGAPKWFVAQKIHQVIEPKPQSGCFHQTHHPFPKSLKNVAKYIESTQGFSSTGNRERSSSSAKLIIAGSCRPLIFLYIVVSYFINISNFLPNPVSIIFLKVAISKSDRSFSIREIYVLEVPLFKAKSCCVNPLFNLASLIN
jgi:hypothetical protein